MPLKFHLMFKNEAKILSGGFIHFLTVSIQFSQLPVAIDSQIKQKDELEIFIWAEILSLKRSVSYTLTYL